LKGFECKTLNFTKVILRTSINFAIKDKDWKGYCNQSIRQLASTYLPRAWLKFYNIDTKKEYWEPLCFRPKTNGGKETNIFIYNVPEFQSNRYQKQNVKLVREASILFKNRQSNRNKIRISLQFL
jgi:hypothetical protein